MQERKATRFAHTAGHTNICFSEDGEYIVTCGSEGDVRIWKGLDDDNPTEKCVGEKALAVVQKNNKLFVASDFSVQVLSFPEAEVESVLTRFKGLVTTITASSDGTYIVAGSMDREIHLVEIATANVKYFDGHKGSILSVAFDPRQEFLVSSSCDGNVHVWNILDQSIAKKWMDVTDYSNSFENRKTLCGVSFEPKTGRLLAVTYKDEIKLFQRNTWNEISSLKKLNTTYLSVITWSKCGRYLAAGTYEGEIIVWDTLINKTVSSSVSKDKYQVTGLWWNPIHEKSQLAFVDCDGQFGVIDNCYSKPSLTSNDQMTNSKNTVEGNSNDEINGIDDDNFEAVQEDENDPNVISLEKIKASSGLNFENGSDVYNLNDNDSDKDDEMSVKSIKSSISPLHTIDLHPPFQPTSMPPHLQRRFMVFNDVGYAKQTNTEEENTIVVDFHDASVHHSFTINNTLGHSIAALNSNALVLACEQMDQTPSKVVCMRFNAWDGKKSWTVDLPEYENAKLVAVGQNFIAVMTDFNFLRIFTLSGLQRDVLSVPGIPLTMDASHNLLVVVYYGCADPTGKQRLYFNIYEVNRTISVVTNNEPLPLTRDSHLRWIGFSDNLNFCSHDSNGTVQLYTMGVWKPISLIDEELDVKSNHYFVVGVNENLTNIRCILCKGSFYPLLIPHPFITEVKWNLPVCEKHVERGVLEQEVLTTKLIAQCASRSGVFDIKSFVRPCIKLFALSVRAGFEMKAIDLLNFLNNPIVSETAYKYCSEIGNVRLADRISELLVEQKSKNRETTEIRSRIPQLVPERKEENMENASSKIANSDQSNTLQELNVQNKPIGKSSITSGSVILNVHKKKSLSELNKELNKRKINPFKISQPAAEQVECKTPPVIEKQSTISSMLSENNSGEKSEKKPNESAEESIQNAKRKSCSDQAVDEQNKRSKPTVSSKLKAFSFQKQKEDTNN